MPPPPTQQPPKEIKVLLTGYGSFSRIAENPSFGIVASILSSPVPVTITTIPGYTVTLVPYPVALRVAYTQIDSLIPQLWEEAAAAAEGGWDYVLHLGVGLEGGFKFESRAWERGYRLKDVDGFAPDGAVDMYGVHGSENPAAAKGEGRELWTGLDTAWITALVAGSVVAKEDGLLVDIVRSTDPGMYLCGYVFRASLMEAEKRGDAYRKSVAFLHVPPQGKKYGIETGREVVLKVVEGMVRDDKGVRE
ncbi:hypothetical protein FN846DRAFT_13110 [Sphaerosporella brunnea]|uniref:Peptidase C15, pyroglutamyl peptidase I-like protein n=1 Tax=Sphaerosporella brunnea TaxID=1250544 RepID=A0A5J5EWS2_9PEZI|nr:hypothetical protein FN846DRAFT_13110 [Sphaerosporella brunnea]